MKISNWEIESFSEKTAVSVFINKDRHSRKKKCIEVREEFILPHLLIVINK